MDVLSALGEIVRDLLIVMGALVVLLISLVVVVARMSAHNPFKRLLTALCMRIAATAAAGVLAIPIEPIPGLDALYDIGALLGLAVYWISFFRNAGRFMSNRSPPRNMHRLPKRNL